MLESNTVLGEPVGVDLKGAGDAGVCEHGTCEGCCSVALQGHVVDGLAEEGVATFVQCLDGHIDRLLVGCKEQVVGCSTWCVFYNRASYRVAKTGVARG